MTTKRIARFAFFLLVATVAIIEWRPHTRQLTWRDRLELFLETERIGGATLAARHNAGSTEVWTFDSTGAHPAGLIKTTSLPIASLSKPITAAAIRKLVDSGDIHLNARAVKLWPSLAAARDSRVQSITVRHLLTHTSGIPGGIEDALFRAGQVTSCREAIQKMQFEALVDEPGHSMVYSNTGYCLLGAIIERETSLDYASAVQSLLNLPDGIYVGPVTTHDDGSKFSFWNSIGPTGGWFSSAETLVDIFSCDARDPSIDTPPPVDYIDSYYGLGWRTWPQADGSYYLTHFGSLPGVFSVALAYPDGRAAVTLLAGRPRDDEYAFKQLVTILQDMLATKGQNSAGHRPSKLSCRRRT